jgi:hypothetical protein
MKNSLLAVSIAAVSLFAAPDATAAAGENGNPKSCSAMIVSADETKDNSARRGKSFRATAIMDVKVRAVIPASVTVGDDEIVRFRFTTPLGHHYQTIEVPVASSKKPGERERRRSGYPFPLKAQQPKPLDVDGKQAQAVESRLLVAGTAIMENGLYGLWTVEGLVGDARPCEATFRLEP